MDLIDRLKSLGERAAKTKEQVLTEEATKNAFIMPFIAALGYDVFNPAEVIPEYTADVRGIKKGEKVDYCIQKDEAPIIIMECKHWKMPLKKYSSQIYRYFGVVHAKFAIYPKITIVSCNVTAAIAQLMGSKATAFRIIQ